MIFKWFRKKESIALGGKYLTCKAMPGITEIFPVYKHSNKWKFRTVCIGDNWELFEFKLKREAVAAREKLIIFYEKWR